MDQTKTFHKIQILKENYFSKKCLQLDARLFSFHNNIKVCI